MGKHFRPAKDFRKSGLTVEIRPFHSKGNGEGELSAKKDYEAKAMESAIRKLKTLCYNEGMTKEMKDREFFQSKGQKRRKAKAEGKMRFRSKMRDRMREVGY